MHVESLGAKSQNCTHIVSDRQMTDIGPAFSLLCMQPARQMQADMLPGAALPNPARNIMFTCSCWESCGRCCDSLCVCIWTICRQAAYFFGLKQSWCRETKFQVFVLMSTVLRLLNNCCKPCVWYSDSSPEHTVRTQRAQRSVDTTGQLYLIIDH